MTKVIIEAGTLQFNEEDLTATGLLVPYGVKCRSNLGEFTVDSGVFSIPGDLTGMSLNVEHQREDVVGGFTKAWEQEDGIYSTFKYANTEAGRLAFEEGKSGKRKNLSAEVSGVRIQGEKAIAGRLFAAAQVERPAFAGATLLAAEDTPVDAPAEEAVEQDDKHLRVALATEELPEDITAVTPEGQTAVYTPEPTPAEENPTNEEPLMASENEAGASVPATLLAGGLNKKNEEVDLGTVFASISAVRNGVDTGDAETFLGALSDIKYDASGGLTTANSGVLQPAWVSRLWQGKRYERKYMSLGTYSTGGIQLGGRKGFVLDQGTALVQEWNGNKTELPSGTASTAIKQAFLKKFAFAADIAREWYDLEGGADVLQAFFEGVVDSYAKITDQYALTQIFNAASKTSANLDRLVAPGTFPSVDGHDYETAMGMVIQGIEAIADADDDADFAIVNPAAWSQILYTPKDLVPEYVTFNVGAGTGAGTADGKLRIVKAPQSFFPGTVTTAPQVIVGAKRAIEFRELGSTPIQIDALDIARGGIDKATLGYVETFVVRPESLVLIGTKTA